MPEGDHEPGHDTGFLLHHGQVVIRVAGETELAAATRNTVVAFQADELDPDLRTTTAQDLRPGGPTPLRLEPIVCHTGMAAVPSTRVNASASGVGDAECQATMTSGRSSRAPSVGRHTSASHSRCDTVA